MEILSYPERFHVGQKVLDDHKLVFLCINESPPFLGPKWKGALIWKGGEVRNRMYNYDFSSIGNLEIGRIAKNCPFFVLRFSMFGAKALPYTKQKQKLNPDAHL